MTPRGRPRIHPPRDPDAPRRPRGRPSAARMAPHIVIGGQRVTWAFIKSVYKRLGCSWDDTIDAFWKARGTTGSNGIYRYITAGFQPGKNGVPWITLPSRERENGQMASIYLWWEKLYTPAGARQETISAASDEVRSMLADLTEKLGMSI